jgi:hypothetical protein
MFYYESQRWENLSRAVHLSRSSETSGGAA